ncbi:MAG: VOC family protein [Acidobacteriota bacterium]
MLHNRSVPRATVIPQLAYPDVAAAAEWLCTAFGFTVRLRIANHRAQLNVGDGAIVITEQRHGHPTPGHSLMIRVEGADAYYARATRAGARTISPPTDYPYGERQCTVEDLAGHLWTFSQSIADVDPRDWDGEPVEL